MCLATFDGKLVTPKQIPNLPIPIYQYDSTFRTMEIIKMIEQDLREHGIESLEVLDREEVTMQMIVIMLGLMM